MTRLLPLLVASVALALPASAPAASSVTVEGSFTKSKGKTTMLVSGSQQTDDGSQPPTVTSLDLWLPVQLRVDLRGLKACRRARLEARGPAGCPRASRIGSGDATAVWANTGVSPQLSLFYGGRNRVLMLARAQTPIVLNQVITAELAGTGGLYSLLMTIPVPANIQQPAGSPAAITRIGASVGAMLKVRRKRRSFLSLGRCGALGAHHFKAVMTLADGRRQTAVTATPCA